MLSGTLTPFVSANWISTPRRPLDNNHHPEDDETKKKDRRNSKSGSNNNQQASKTTITPKSTTEEPQSEPKAPKETRSRPQTTTLTESAGRSTAIEKAYVHDVYENCGAEDTSSGNNSSSNSSCSRVSLNPSVSKFLAALEPGSFVCDVGSGDGRYLSVQNPLLYTIGVDRCYRLTKVARGNGGEVAICDNLDLPFRDESFDAVLSLAVVHHFATTERRVGAIRELARILRIGGRVIITVWALEQRNRRFESQDVLVPWTPNSRNGGMSGDEDDEDDNVPYHPCAEDSTTSTKSVGDGDTSSLSSSSPSDTCYSFVRKAIQKLAGGKKSPWFLESWGSKEAKHDNSFDYEDAKDLPIELRRIEDFDDIPNDATMGGGVKSNSLTSILNPPPPSQIVRSRSSVPSLIGHEELLPDNSQCSSCQTGSTLSLIAPTNSYNTSIESLRRPKLVKQKQSLQDDTEYHLGDKHSKSLVGDDSERNVIVAKTISSIDEEASQKSKDPHEIFKETYGTVVTPVVAGATSDTSRVQLLRKQSSLNEEFERVAESRIREKDRIRKKIQKQTSLNETFLCRSLFTKRLQVIREGFTTKLKTSTGSLERVTKNGFVKIMQNIKIPNPNQFVYNPPLSRTNSIGSTLQPVNPEEERTRRHSRESGSDSSKDSSLQSDTSIESEDSFASVIYIPKPEQLQQMNSSSFDYTLSCTTPNSSKIPSVPTSPLVFPCPPTPAHSPAPPRSGGCGKQPSSGNLTMKETIHFTFDTQFQKPQTTTDDNTASPQLLANTKMGTKQQSPPVLMAQLSPNSLTVTAAIAKPLPKITKQQIKDLPPIPKHPSSKSNKASNKQASFPIVRRVSAAPIVPKLKSLEIFNPETDDLDSDSSEPSSPDSVDSVISTVKTPNVQTEQPTTSLDEGAAIAQAQTLVKDTLQDAVEYVIRERKPNLDPNHGGCDNITDEEERRKHLAEFAEKLSAQLMKELEENNLDPSIMRDHRHKHRHSFDNKQTTTTTKLPEDDPFFVQVNGEDSKDFNQLRKELRERRLMLADLCSNSSSSVSSINNGNSVDRAFYQHDLIPEEDPDTYNEEFNEINYRPDVALIQEEDDSSESLQTSRKTNSQTQQQQQQPSSSNKNIKSNIVSRFTRNRSSSSNKSNSSNQQRSARHGNDAWAHSTSTASLDSPSVGGGSATHHRYFHVFREGELDTLINHHVASLHIVSSYYERASWCVVAEKVQVWTI
ncbi:uncharacterized protein LOC134837724 [Culicoides brevitarsis]|uniref:uncharacterized protein LOC134837724 n=1 Tax=Culicoides brevitarsis TaxID=469753 RepID=UPI00307B74AF